MIYCKGPMIYCDGPMIYCKKTHEILRKAHEILQRSMELLQYTVWHRKHRTSNEVSNWNENTTCTLNTACIQSNRCYLNFKKYSDEAGGMFFVFLCIVQCLYESKPSLMMTADSNPILAVTSHFSLVTPPLTQKLYAFCAFKTKTFGHHCSSYIASSVQNFLPHEIRNIQPTTASKTALKACLFQICYWVGVNC